MADHLFEDETLAGLYDAMCPRETRADFDFYLPMVMAAEAVLDVGCGTGAMLHEARDAGHRGRLCGVDPAAGMLAQARRRSDIAWVLGDLTTGGWDAEFDLIVMTGHAFQVLVEDAEVDAALAAAARALKPGGTLAFETRNPQARAWEGWTADQPTAIPLKNGMAATMVREVETGFDGRTVSFRHTFTHPAWPEPQTSRSTLRFMSPPELDAALARAGLAVAQRFGDFDRSPFTDASPEIVVLARREA